MMKTTNILPIVFALILAVACKKKEGCTDPKATNYDVKSDIDNGTCSYPVYGCMNVNSLNYDSLATVSDGSCIFASKARITAITVESYPTVNNEGNPWDDSDIADPFIRIVGAPGEIWYQTAPFINSPAPLTWSISPSVTIVNFTADVIIELHDADETTDRLMGSSSFWPNDYTIEGHEDNKYPPSIEITSDGYTFTLSLEWVE